MTAAVPTAMDCHGRPASTSRPTASGAARAPMLNDVCRRFMARPAALAIHVEHEAVRPAVERARPRARHERRDDERRPARGEAEARDAGRVDQHRAAQHEPPAEALGQGAAAERPGHVGDGVHEVDHADPGVGLIEGRLDRADQRRDQQPGPADGQEREAPDDAQRQPRAAGGRARPGILHRPTIRRMAARTSPARLARLVPGSVPVFSGSPQAADGPRATSREHRRQRGVGLRRGSSHTMEEPRHGCRPDARQRRSPSGWSARGR